MQAASDGLTESLAQWAVAHRWPFTLAAIALSCALVTFLFLEFYDVFAPTERAPPLFGAWIGALKLFLLTAPVIWVGLIFAPTLLIVAKVHAALYGTFVTLTALTSQDDYASPGAMFVPLLYGVLFAVLGIDLVAILLTHARLWKEERRAKGPRFVLIGLTAALLGGWAIDALVWAESMPTRIILSARWTAGDRPYCIEVEGRPLRTARDLAGVGMRALVKRRWTSNFRVLLVIGLGAERTYMNRSFRRGRFDPISDARRPSFRLDRERRCTPE